mmetsp:Transcript_4282/g.12711  ORF Transcript_4282/g.12711 Transcript_4282/m.12711 type:complete len:272 (+) Transcript_4282:736-1551(+)
MPNVEPGWMMTTLPPSPSSSSSQSSKFSESCFTCMPERSNWVFRRALDALFLELSFLPTPAKGAGSMGSFVSATGDRSPGLIPSSLPSFTVLGSASKPLAWRRCSPLSCASPDWPISSGAFGEPSGLLAAAAPLDRAPSKSKLEKLLLFFGIRFLTMPRTTRNQPFRFSFERKRFAVGWCTWVSPGRNKVQEGSTKNSLQMELLSAMRWTSTSGTLRMKSALESISKRFGSSSVSGWARSLLCISSDLWLKSSYSRSVILPCSTRWSMTRA